MGFNFNFSKMKLGLISLVGAAYGAAIGEETLSRNARGVTFPDEMRPGDRFWLEAAAQALDAAQEKGELHGYGISGVNQIFCNRMIDIRNEGTVGETHTKFCNMHWNSLSWGQANNCITSMEITACKMCRMRPTADNFATECSPEV